MNYSSFSNIDGLHVSAEPSMSDFLSGEFSGKEKPHLMVGEGQFSKYSYEEIVAPAIYQNIQVR